MKPRHGWGGCNVLQSVLKGWCHYRATSSQLQMEKWRAVTHKYPNPLTYCRAMHTYALCGLFLCIHHTPYWQRRFDVWPHTIAKWLLNNTALLGRSQNSAAIHMAGGECWRGKVRSVIGVINNRCWWRSLITSFLPWESILLAQRCWVWSNIIMEFK